jgi:hypothetical protein
MKKIKGIVIFLLFTFTLSTSKSQIIVNSIDLKGYKYEIPADSVLSLPVHLLFSKIIQKLKIPKDFDDIEGGYFSVYAIYENKLIDKQMVRGTYSAKVNKLILKVDDQIYKRLKKYLVLKQKTFYLIYIPINFSFKQDNSPKDSIYLEKSLLWGINEVITIAKPRLYY